MSQMYRVALGTAPHAPGAHNTLALKIADFGKRQGFAFAGIGMSRDPTSPSRYLRLRDVRGRTWLVRISNHYRPANTGHPKPHLDLVSFDGVAGYDEACLFLSKVFGGLIPWFNPAAAVSATTPRKRRR